MKYYLIVGEASGDLHASHLMSALKTADPQADFRFFGGDLMAAVFTGCRGLSGTDFTALHRRWAYSASRYGVF